MIPCYVGGKGMYATAKTRDVKTAVIVALEEGGMGYDTRYRYYRRQFPDMSTVDLARLVCDPIENYDRDWPAGQAAECDDNERITAFFLERDTLFREEAHVGIFCLDEAGFGSGVNVMRFIHAGKPVLGIYHSGAQSRAVNVGNFLQLRMEHPNLISLFEYQTAADMLGEVQGWLSVQPAVRC